MSDRWRGETSTLAVTAALTDDLRRRRYQGHPNPLRGHCYVASEALMHLAGPRSGLRPATVRHEGGVHWYLLTPAGKVVDPTAGQFKTPPPYARGGARGFLTREPSRRAAEVIRRVRAGIR